MWLDFDAPKYLILLAILPVFWLVGRQSLSALGAWRRKVALLMRLAIAAALVVALAEPNWLRLIDRLTVLFLVDASDSIEREELDRALDYVNAAAGQRHTERGDRAGVVVFGREAEVEVPPLAEPWRLAKIESEYDPRFTNLESALALAKATFPADSAKRVVIISDGNETAGRALQEASSLLNSGVGIDSVPISYERKGDVRVEKVAAPTDIRRGTPFSLRIILNNLRDDRKTSGKLRVSRSFGGTETVVVEDSITLEPGKHPFEIRQELAESGMSTYEARFIPDDPSQDLHSENNVATAFCRVGGRGHVLVIEDASQAGRFDDFVRLLRTNDIEVTVRDTQMPFSDLTDLQQFDCVVLADVARVAGEGMNDLTQFSDSQIHALVQNTEHFGAGLIVLGGPNSYGAGGWINTELEKALPVNCQIDNVKADAVGALVLVIDSSGSMQGPKIAWSKAAAIAASKMLGKRDFLGVVAFDSEARWVSPLRRNDAPQHAQARIDRLGAAGGTNMMPGLQQAYRAIEKVPASLKHVIVLTDGQTPKDNFAGLVASMRKRDITTTGVAVGPDADGVLLSSIASRGGGKFYRVVSPNAIPRIFMREARRVAMPLIFEDQGGIAVQSSAAGEMMSGISTPPPVTGYVLTTLKEHPLVDVHMASPRQPPPLSTVLATWQYGLGRSAALTTDVGKRWASNWPEWADYEKLMLQMVRWTMRGHGNDEKLAISAESRNGFVDVVVSALNPDDANINLLNLSGTVVLPNGEPQSFSVQQEAPGRYTAKIPAQEPGNYYLSVAPSDGTAPLRAALNVVPTAEHDNLFSYDGFMTQLAEGVPKDGEHGRVIQSPRGIADTQTLLATDVFRPGVAQARSRSSLWPLLLLAASMMFLGDVFCRRVDVSFEWVPQLRDRLLRRNRADAATASVQMERLKKTKTSATARFDGGDREFAVDVANIPSESAPAVDTPRRAAPAVTETTGDGEQGAGNFTSRLLDVKKRVREERDAHRPDLQS